MTDTFTFERPHKKNEPDLFPDLLSELRQTAVDLARGTPPTTTLGVLLERREPTTPETIAGILGRPIESVDWALDLLEADGLVVRFRERGILKALAFAPYES